MQLVVQMDEVVIRMLMWMRKGVVSRNTLCVFDPDPPLRLGSRSTSMKPPATLAIGRGVVNVYVEGAGLMGIMVWITGQMVFQLSHGILLFLDTKVEMIVA